ncbi:hypothetical protein MUK42_33809 [Musa troglodytarum]|uniref:Uncharacterized protein n=1 Tax=Musa troglodytarum TaxID=320322 RepID=A0A9E7JYB0_9LILI|nr:hypothetical protein MUK42_33809 [Musa troglodytarum]
MGRHSQDNRTRDLGMETDEVGKSRNPAMAPLGPETSEQWRVASVYSAPLDVTRCTPPASEPSTKRSFSSSGPRLSLRLPPIYYSVGFNQHGRLTAGSFPPHNMRLAPGKAGYLRETNQKPMGDGCTLASSDRPPVNDCYQLVYIDAGGWVVLEQYG